MILKLAVMEGHCPTIRLPLKPRCGQGAVWKKVFDCCEGGMRPQFTYFPAE